jgi:antitoxin (DNA-binding transcriptional repressor) of toxin-antitoxin stability system
MAGLMPSWGDECYINAMKKARIAELRRGLSRYLGYVRKGGTVLVFDRDVPAAKVVPLEKKERDLPNGRAAAKRRVRKSVSNNPASPGDEFRVRRSAEDEVRLDRLERAGIIRRGKGDIGEWLRTHELPVKLPPGVKLKGSVLEALLEERESGW